jgi:acetoin utilization deacetylase AcuC-like enzyme
MRTGLFFYYQIGERLRDFPQALEGILERENIFFYDAFYPSKPPSSIEVEPISKEMLYQVHSQELVEKVIQTGNFEGALFSASSTVRAAEKIWMGEIDNAFIFTGYGDHHAAKTFFGGGCYFNGAAITIQMLRKRFRAQRFAIIDTDAHHGDGTWEIFEADPNVLYVCFCSHRYLEENNKINIQVPHRVTDEEYLDLVRNNFLFRVTSFQPEILFWNWGYDGTQGDYGDIGLTPNFHTLLANELKGVTNEICQGRLIVVLCGGSRRDLARHLIPELIGVLSGEDSGIKSSPQDQ